MKESKKTISPCGTWHSPIKASDVANVSTMISDLQVNESEAYWVENRPAEGRSIVVKYCEECNIKEITPEGFNVKTSVHEYGGGTIAVHNSTVFFCNESKDKSDKRIYRHARGEHPIPITLHDPNSQYADLHVSPDGKILYCVRETIPPENSASQSPVSEIVAINTYNDTLLQQPTVIASNMDFFASPCVSNSGRYIAWISWNHPNMPWNSTELWVAELNGLNVYNKRRVAGGVDGISESIVQPEWSLSDVLHFISDRSGWWNLYKLVGDRVVHAVEMDAEWAAPSWKFGSSRYGFTNTGKIVAAPINMYEGGTRLGFVNEGKFKYLQNSEFSYSSVAYLRCKGKYVWFVGATPTSLPHIVRLNVETLQADKIKSNTTDGLDESYISVPEHISFDTTQGQKAHAWLYMPHSRQYQCSLEERPPLIVIAHGGPTSASYSELDVAKQFWTTRGFAVIDVNYRGSSGYGTEYRDALNGQWGIHDVADCEAAAQHLVNAGKVDSKRIAIRGKSAGGYLVLSALTCSKTFSAGVSYYGVSDLETLVKDTHKFESRYLDNLVAPYSEHQQEYKNRSPIHRVHRISCPVLLLQGEEDRIVPVEQAQRIADALEASGNLYRYILFPEEGHGFVNKDNIIQSLETELEFYGSVFQFKLLE